MKKSSKIKKLHLPLKQMTAKEKDYAAAILEDVNDNFRAFGEVLDGVRKKGDATFEEVGRINERLISVEIKQDLMAKKLDSIEITINDIKKEILVIKEEIKELKLSLSKKVDIERLEDIELRVAQIEKHLKLAY